MGVSWISERGTITCSASTCSTILVFFKYTMNRTRPYQINPSIRPLYYFTVKTTAFPAGHVLQTY